MYLDSPGFSWISVDFDLDFITPQQVCVIIDRHRFDATLSLLPETAGSGVYQNKLFITFRTSE